MYSELLKMYKALEGQQLAQRIQGAMVKVAHYHASGDGADATDKAFGELVLEDPLREWLPMKIEVAANVTIQEALSVDPSGNIDDRNVKDTDIEYVVNDSWHKVAVKVIQPVVD